MIINIIIKFWAILVAIFCAIILTYNIIEPKLNEMCLINTNECLSISYIKIDNSILINVNPQDYWLWFDGVYLLVYNLETTRNCQVDGNTKYEEVFVYDPKERKILNFMCGMKLDILKKEYMKYETQTLYYRINFDDVDIYSVLEILEKKNIIHL